MRTRSMRPNGFGPSSSSRMNQRRLLTSSGNDATPQPIRAGASRPAAWATPSARPSTTSFTYSGSRGMRVQIGHGRRGVRVRGRHQHAVDRNPRAPAGQLLGLVEQVPR